jgi:hypothetical protein
MKWQIIAFFLLQLILPGIIISCSGKSTSPAADYGVRCSRFVTAEICN